MKHLIKHKVASIILITFVPLIIYAIYHYVEMVKHDKEHLKTHNLEIALAISNEIDELIKESFSILRTLSTHPAVKTRNVMACDRLFTALLPHYPNHLNIIASDMLGNNYGSGVKLPTKTRVNYRNSEWFDAGRLRQPAVRKHQISKHFNYPAVMISLPVVNEGKQVGVIALPLNLLKIEDRIAKTWHLPVNSVISLIDSKGYFLITTFINKTSFVPTLDQKILQKIQGPATGNFEAVCSDGIKRLHSFSSLVDADWKVIIGVPIEEAFMHAYMSNRRYLMILLVVALATLTSSSLLSKRLTNNIYAVVNGLKEIGQGDLSYKLQLSDHDELNTVATSFNKIARDREETETKLKESKFFLTSVLNGMGEGLVVIDRDYKIISANKGYCAQAGMPCEDIIGKHCYQVSHHYDEPCYKKENGCDCTVQKCFETGDHHRAIHTHYTKDGDHIHIETNAYPLRDDNGNVHSAIETLMDVTDKKKLEDQLFQAQKMEAVGLLAGGVAHDFNNILTAIMGYGSIVLKNMEGDDSSRQLIENMLASTDRASHLTRSLLAFSRKQIIDPIALNINDVIVRLEKLLARIIGEDIELKINLSSSEAPVLADVGQIEQVLMNLCTNARDAMPEGGLLMIETERVILDDDYVKKYAFTAPGTYMLISVTDSGTGMDEETREKIFEPFFTTKEIGKGTGLGLSIIYGIIKQHNGYVNVYSEQEKGTTFRIYLPVIAAPAEKLTSPVIAPVVGGTESVLLAEDEDAVRELTKDILEDYGYNVILAEDGADAIEKFKVHVEAIDLLILDAIMPKKSGRDVFDEVRKLKPEVKTLFMSGYTQNMIHKEGVLSSGFELITKPFSPNAFLRKVREVLDK